MSPALRLLVPVASIALVSAAGWLTWRAFTAPRLDQDRIAIYRAQLDDADPEVRLAAATHLRAAEADGPTERLAAGRALYELGRYDACRQMLGPLAASGRGVDAVAAQALPILADSYLLQAEERLNQGTIGSVQTLRVEIEELLREAQSIVDLMRMNDSTGPEGSAALAQARLLDQRAQLLRLVLRVVDLRLARARSVDDASGVQELGLEGGDLRSQIDALDHRIQALCRTALQRSPQDAQAMQLQFRAHLRRSEPDLPAARAIAQTLARLSVLDLGVAGGVAHRLMTLDSHMGLPVGEPEVEQAWALLRHPNLRRRGSTASQRIEFSLAQALVALHRDQPAQAMELARAVLDRYVDHPAAASLLARAMTQMGRPGDAVKLLLPINERLRVPAIQSALGLAYLEAGQSDSARATLRQCLESEPDNLPIRLAVIRSLMVEGRTLDAAADIAAAVLVNPDHPEVRASEVRLATERRDVSRLALLLARQRGTGPRSVVQPAMLLAAMTVGDLPRVEAVIDEWDAQRARLPELTACAQAWRAASLQARPMLAATLARLGLDLLDDNPLAHALPIQTLALAPSDSVASMVYIAWPQEQALRVVELALEESPGHAGLLELAAELSLWANRPEEAQKFIARLRASPIKPTLASALIEASLAGRTVALSSEVSKVLGPLTLMRTAVAQGQPTHAVEQLRKLLAEQPWAQPAAAFLLEDALTRRDQMLVDTTLEASDAGGNPMGLLLRGVMNVRLSRYDAALESVKGVGEQAGAEPELLLQLAEVRARAHLGLGQAELASGEFQNLVHLLPWHAVEARLLACRVLEDGGRERAAELAWSALLADSQVTDCPPRVLDAVLAHAAERVPPAMLRDLIETMLEGKPGDPLLTLYLAQSQIRMGLPEDAQDTVRTLLREHEHSPRVVTALAMSLASQGRIEQAMQTVQPLLARGEPLASRLEAALHAAAQVGGKSP